MNGLKLIQNQTRTENQFFGFSVLVQFSSVKYDHMMLYMQIQKKEILFPLKTRYRVIQIPQKVIFVQII